jgi:hypothetical protein
MPRRPVHARHASIFLSSELSRPALARGQREGRYVKVAKGIYSADTVTPLDAIVAANLWRIVAEFCPDAILVDRTAALGGRADRGVVTIATDARSTDLDLPGVRVLVRPRVAHGTDLPWPEGLRIAAPARALVDNLAPSRGRGGRPGRTLTAGELEDWLAEKRISYGEVRFRQLEASGCDIAAQLGRGPEEVRALFATVEGRAADARVRGELARAALQGSAWDARRLGLFAACAERLAAVDVPALPAPAEDGELPFYEAYFSNFIEGTEFTVPDAREIVETQVPPARRAPDGHDLLGTYRCVVDPIGRATTSEDPDETVALLLTRHQTLMAGRPDVGPGAFKERANRSGGTEFVRPELVLGTLLRAFARKVDLPPGLSRALYVMLVVAEVHPFADGNGRAARLMMNAELSAVGQCRIVIPTVLRNDSIAALRRFSNHGGDIGGVLDVLELAWRWTAAMPWGDRAAADGQMSATDAVLDPLDAERSGRRLRLP